MAIILHKILQDQVFDLYMKTEIALTNQNNVRVVQKVYESKGHFEDDFLPIILKSTVVSNAQRVNTIKLLLANDYEEAVSVVENFLVNNIPYYNGGVLENGEII